MVFAVAVLVAMVEALLVLVVDVVDIAVLTKMDTLL
jgi:hypothetical protein